MGRLIYTIWNNTLNSVIFGIATMLMIGTYIAVGSGLASVREYFEMNELQFFSSWVLVGLMLMLVLNLATVTIGRIPFTPPRYGVWCVHVGIVTLIFGMFAYYSQKVEGLILIPAKATVEHYYDSYERAIFARVDRRHALPVPIPDLPRFESYRAGTPSADRLNEKSLRGIAPVFMMSRGDEVVERTLGQELGLSVEPKIDVIGYHPYAGITTDFVEAQKGDGTVGIKLTLSDEANGRQAEEWIVEDADGAGRSFFLDTMFDHRNAKDAAVETALVDAASKFHRLDFLVGTEPVTLFVEPGKSYEVGKTGYSITIENYLPNWRTMQGETVDLLTFMVQSPTMKFRRQVIPGRSNPTDWKLDDPAAGPMGNRQDKPLDNNFKTLYTFRDPAQLLSTRASVRHTLVTTPDGGITEIRTARDQAVQITKHANGTGGLEVRQIPPRGPFQPKLSAEEIAEFPVVKVGFERKENVRRIDSVIDVPKAKRDRDEGAAGIRQVVTVKISAGDTSKIVHVPFAQYAAENFAQWQGNEIWLPGATKPLQLQLGNTLRPLPAKITLEKFELVPYAGGSKQSGLMRDFRATLRVVDNDSGTEKVGVAAMNEPVYFERKLPWYAPDESWLFFQSGFNPQAGEQLSILGIGNRPGVITMTVGSIMIGLGLLYAFYLKPIIVQRMKRNAIEVAAAKAGRTSPRAATVQV